LGLNPNSDGKVIHLNLPPLNEERRRDLVKHMHHRLEEARIAVRNIRRDLHNDIRDFEKEKLITEDDLKRGEEDLQKLTDKFHRRNCQAWRAQRKRDHGSINFSDALCMASERA
jgi:ribosome recycling factor